MSRILVLPGDGIGPEIVAEALKVLERVGEIGGLDLEARDRGDIIGILPDQSPKGASGTHAPFFGHPALTMTLLPRLLRGRDDHVVFLFAERLPKGRGFRYHEIEAGPEVADRDFARAAAAINAHVEALVRRCPEQYNWAYKRFHPAPEGQPSPYRSAE